MANKLNGENKVILKKLFDISVGFTGSIMDLKQPRLFNRALTTKRSSL